MIKLYSTLGHNHYRILLIIHDLFLTWIIRRLLWQHSSRRNTTISHNPIPFLVLLSLLQELSHCHSSLPVFRFLNRR